MHIVVTFYLRQHFLRLGGKSVLSGPLVLKVHSRLKVAFRDVISLTLTDRMTNTEQPLKCFPFYFLLQWWHGSCCHIIGLNAKIQNTI